MNSEQIEALLGLDPIRVTAVAGATEDYARLLRAGQLEPLELDATADAEEEEEQRDLCIASAFATAASLWVLLDAHRAAPLFSEAAQLQVDAGAGPSDVLSICAHPRDASVTPPFDDSARRVRSPEATVLSLLAPLARGTMPPFEVDHALERLTEVTARPRATPAGTLRLPLGLYIDVLVEVATLRRGQVEPWRDTNLKATGAYLARVDETTSLAKADRHHWTMPGIGLLPVQPEVVATCALVNIATRDMLDQRLIDVVDVADGPAAAAAVVAAELVAATDGHDNPEPLASG